MSVCHLLAAQHEHGMRNGVGENEDDSLNRSHVNSSFTEQNVLLPQSHSSKKSQQGRRISTRGALEAEEREDAIQRMNFIREDE